LFAEIVYKLIFCFCDIYSFYSFFSYSLFVYSHGARFN